MTVEALPHEIIPVYRVVFAYESDLQGSDSEFRRYKKGFITLIKTIGGEFHITNVSASLRRALI